MSGIKFGGPTAIGGSTSKRAEMLSMSPNAEAAGKELLLTIPGLPADVIARIRRPETTLLEAKNAVDAWKTSEQKKKSGQGAKNPFADKSLDDGMEAITRAFGSRKPLPDPYIDPVSRKFIVPSIDPTYLRALRRK